MKFEFKINKYYLVGYAMASKHKPFPAWQKLEEKIWQKYREEPSYYFLNPRHISWALEQIQINFSDKNIKNISLKHTSTLEKIYQEIFKSKEFKRLYKETNQHLYYIKNQWENNERKALGIFQKISGLPLPKQRIVVYITHPKSRNAKTLDRDTIVIGRTENWKNYLTVYLCHELLHIMTWPGHFQPDFDILHAIIMLADDELKIRLNKNGKYLNFKKEELNTESIKLINLAKKLLPYWKKYLAGKLGKNILELKIFLDKYKKRDVFEKTSRLR